MNILDKLINERLEAHGIFSAMYDIALKYNSQQYIGLGDACSRVVDMISSVFRCSYFDASKLFAEKMRERHQINVH